MSTHSASTPQLIVVDGPMRGSSFAIPAGRSEIGREAGLGILLDDKYVSLRHAVVERTGRRVVLTDLSSGAGVTLAPVGFAAFAGGGILYGIGSSMSKAARKREEQYRDRVRHRRQWM